MNTEGVLNNHPKIIAIIPAYDEAGSLSSIIERTQGYVNEIVVVDDGSTDNTFEIASAMKSIVLRNKRNMGKGFSLRRGINEALKHNPDIVITMDADGQHDPTDIPRLLVPILADEADIVIGSRYGNNRVLDAPKYRKVGLSIINFAYRLQSKSSIKDTQSGYRAYNKNVLNTMIKYDSLGYGAEIEQLALAELHGYKVVEVPVDIKYGGLRRTSKKNPWIHGISILSTLFRITVERRPLAVFGVAGSSFVIGAIVCTSILLAIFNETRYFSVPLALASIGSAIIGMMMISVSLILYALKRIRQREETIVTALFDILNRDKSK